MIVVVCCWTAAAGAVAADAPTSDSWGVGWDDGLTVRRWLGGNWELAVAAGPDDFLSKDEVRSWLLDQPPQQAGSVEVPLDMRQEQGWIRMQVGRLAARRGSVSLVGFAGLAYNWIDYQERSLTLDSLLGDYDTWELDRFTSRWILDLGVRPAWRPLPNVSLEAAFGLRFVWESWDQTARNGYAGIEGVDLVVSDGYGRSFEDRGWEDLSSLQIVFWF